MKIYHHIEKIARFERTIKKLDKDEDSETLIEDYMLASSHFINAAMHKLETLREDKDVKHNNIFGVLKRENSLKEYSEEVADLIQQIEQLRPSYVYGKGENGEMVQKAQEAFTKIKSICNRILKNEGKF
ncbi:hypothetical protein HYW99_03420 [Candidatus Woesearchaeota archaeon]|nr:hypothetical protein [Candidatus Woesearchaeota archaeon]